MEAGWLDDGDAAALSRQAVDILDPKAEVSFSAQPARATSVGYGGGFEPDSGRTIWNIEVRIDDSRCILRLDSGWSPVVALGNLLSELAGACGSTFRGSYFPACPGHQHPANLALRSAYVAVICPDDNHEIAQLAPDTEHFQGGAWPLI